MKITLKPDDNIAEIQYAIINHFDKSRFNVSVDIRYPSRRRTEIHVTNVRLKERKDWCGSHPESCDIQGFKDQRTGEYIKEKPRKSKLLEGGDWVDFNDTLNDVLDSMSISADVSSAVCIVRKGRERRICYDSFQRANAYRVEYEWEKEGHSDDYEDWCGKQAPMSTYPEGTPGNYSREVKV